MTPSAPRRDGLSPRGAFRGATHDGQSWLFPARVKLFAIVVGGRSVAKLVAMESRRSRGGGLVALGGALARSGPAAKISLGLGAAIALFGTGASVVMARGARPEGLANVPLLTSSALAWGAGTLLAFAASVHAFRRDKQQGVRALLAARGRSDGEYLASRILGLARALAAVTAGGTLVAGVAATLLAQNASLAIRTLAGTGASFIFAIAFAATLAPIALATLGARSRVGGYLALIAVLVIPELLGGWAAHVLPEGWAELASIPGALTTLRSSLLPDAFDALRFAHAFAVLALVAAVALFVVRGQLARFDRERPA